MGVLLVAVALLGLLLVLGVLNASGFFRALPLLLLLGGLSFLSYMVVRANIDPAWAGTAAIVAPVALLGWAAWRPAKSGVKLWVMDCARFAILSAMWLGLLAFALALPSVGFRLDAWIVQAWPWLAIAAAAWGVGRMVDLVVVSSVRSGEDMARLAALRDR